MPKGVMNHRNERLKPFISWVSIFIFFLFLLGQPFNAFSQSRNKNKPVGDSVYKYFPAHSPVKATWMSAALPGLGQYYNGKYWKIPLIYAGFSTFVYFIVQNKYEYNRFRVAYNISMEIPDGEVSNNPLVRNYTSQQLLDQREFYQSNLELSYILIGAFYVFQIIDATVDAHLFDYDIDDDLSIHIQPQLMPTSEGLKISPGIGLRFKLSKE